MRDAKSCLSYWFPRLVKAGFHPHVLPGTEIVHTDLNLGPLLDGEDPAGGFEDLIEELDRANRCGRFGYPCFLRTDHLSGKHRWKNTCHVADKAALPRCVANLVEESALADIMGFPTEVWVLRELLPVTAAFFAFGGIPITRERRYFIRDGRVEFHHPYWPPDAFEDAFHETPLPKLWRARLRKANEESENEIRRLTGLSEEVAAILPGYWSVDWMWSDLGWKLIDMAEGERSFRWNDYRVDKDSPGA